ncbi:MAG: helicase C-terminal domain-containing protein [Planctomycetota bacterium]|nr:helicase C-terminal domain-containing protein [Planctomycetota bacterium]
MSERVTDLLGPNGAIARRLDNFEERPEQLRLAQSVEDCLTEGTHLLAEAGTGIGKSFAYLLPAVLHASQHRGDGPVVISTRTIALQQQLELKDIPFLQAVLPVEWSAVTAVGRNNYLCLRRMELARRERGVLFPDPDREEQLQGIVAWSLETNEGTRMALPQPVDHVVWDEVKAEHGNCLHKACPHYERCHYQRSRRRLGSADVLIVNHSLYMADVALRMAGANYLPPHQVVIFDEAHHLERVATESLGLRVSRGSVEWHLRRLHPKNAKRSLLMQFGSAQAKALVASVRTLAGDFFHDLQQRLDECQEETLALGSTTLDMGFADLLEELSDEVSRCCVEIEDLSMRTEMQARASGITALAITVRNLCGPALHNIVRWIERGRKHPELRSAPLDVSEALRSFVFSGERTAVLMSATMDAGAPDFSWMRQRLGIDQAQTLRLGSPFEYDRQVELILEEALPDPAKDPEEFARESHERILTHLLDNRGRALVLCTSWRYLHKLVDRVRSDLEYEGIELLVQGEQPNPELLRRKREIPMSVLIGTDSMWEGIDVPGDALTMLIITRFPFAQPGHPLAEARIRRIEAEGGSGFRDLALPEAILKFRQGFGRLVRSSRDRGKVVVLDPRVRTKRYGKDFLEALPKGVLSDES